MKSDTHLILAKNIIEKIDSNRKVTTSLYFNEVKKNEDIQSVLTINHISHYKNYKNEN